MRITVIGAGIVGLSCAYQLVLRGAHVQIADPDPAGDKASRGNAGGVAVSEIIPASTPGVWRKVPGWLLDPLGPLAIRPAHALSLMPWLIQFARAGKRSEADRAVAALAALNARTYRDLLPMLRTIGSAHAIHHVGALAVYETEDGFRADAEEWAVRRKYAVDNQELSAHEARALEPALGPIVERAILIPQWSHIDDPGRLVDTLRHWLLGHDVSIIPEAAASISPTPAVHLQSGRRLDSDRVVVAAGAWSGQLAAILGDRTFLESERGYNLTFPESGALLSREVIFAERKFVATPLACGLRVGGAAEFGGLRARPRFARANALATLARRYLPGLAQGPGIPWAGHRPATPDSLPVISRSPRHPRVIYAFGHGHLGLTQAATTGALVADLIAEQASGIDLSPYSIARFA